MASQPWSNGKVGTIGCSSTAEWQMGVAALGNPAHAAMVPMGFGAGVSTDQRDPHSKQLTETEAGRYSIRSFFASWDPER
jgi:predicted acyl esterase